MRPGKAPLPRSPSECDGRVANGIRWVGHHHPGEYYWVEYEGWVATVYGHPKARPTHVTLEIGPAERWAYDYGYFSRQDVDGYPDWVPYWSEADPDPKAAYSRIAQRATRGGVPKRLLWALRLLLDLITKVEVRYGCHH